MYRENYIESLRAELVSLVADKLSPIALQYGYSDVALETHIKWRPVVLLLGNYSSGKSTLINELLGCDIQATGQAPTDDSFTVITHDDSVDAGPVRVTEQREGKVLLNDPQYPFESLRKHGQRFAAHFRLKKVNSPFLSSLALIDTPGMLDSMSERDRGYDYQEVIGDLAAIADLVLVLFDPHKAGTVREAHASLRHTLPQKTFEDRLIFVLNRTDECESLSDLLRVYGTLCWNLSQMTGRKDIPLIRLTYSSRAAKTDFQGEHAYLKYLDNQREELRQEIAAAPRHRLDHLAAYVETHGERLGHFLEALLAYQRQRRFFKWKCGFVGLLVALVLGVVAGVILIANGTAHAGDPLLYTIAGISAAAAFVLWMAVIFPYGVAAFNRNRLSDLDQLTTLETQARRDSWQAVRDLVYRHIKKTNGRYSGREIKNQWSAVVQVRDKGAREIREGLNELKSTPPDPVRSL